jgi:hypothetical protein
VLLCQGDHPPFGTRMSVCVRVLACRQAWHLLWSDISHLRCVQNRPKH